MRTRDRLTLALAGVLCTAVIGMGARVLRSGIHVAPELGRTKLATLSDATRARLAALDGEVLITWYASTRAEMPSDYRDMEDGLVPLLGSLEQGSQGKVRTAIVHPSERPELADHFADLGLSPFRARRVERDGFVEEEVWSALRISHAVHGSSTIAALPPEALGYLEPLITAHLDLLEHPSSPKVLLSAPSSFRALRRVIESEADLRECDFKARATLDPDADLFFWIDPQTADADHLRAVHEFLARGKSVVIAGSRFTARPSTVNGEPKLDISTTAFPADALLTEFGVRPASEIVLDSESAERADAPADTRARPTPRVRAIGSHQDFRGFHAAPNGTLLFEAPTALNFDSERLVELGLTPRILASSAESTWLSPPVEGARPLAALERPPEIALAPHIPLAVLLSPIDRWQGELVVCAASTPFSDDYLKHEAFVHAALVKSLIRTLAAPERRAAQRVAIARPAALPELTPRERWLWRSWCVFAGPAALLCVAWLWRRFRGARERAAHALSPARVALGVLGVIACPALLGWALAGPALDLTAAQANSVKADTASHFASASTAPGGLEIETAFSADEHLPSEFRASVRQARDFLRALAAEAPGLELTHRHPEELSPSEAARLQADGLHVLSVTTQADETMRVRKIYSAIVLRRGARHEVLEFPDLASFEHLEFRLRYALARIEGTPRAEVAWAAETPRLSPAEAKLQYQDRGLFAPSEGDVYAAARALLEKNDFRIAGIDPHAPVIPDASNVVVWLQPRRDTKLMWIQVARRLAAGGKVLIAGQHYKVRAQRRAAQNLELSLWPEPQFCDLDTLYLPRLGIDLVRELLLDDLHGSLSMDTKVERRGGNDRESVTFERETATSPLFIRTSRSGSPYLRGLGDQLFVCANRIRMDESRLASLGLSAEIWIASSPRTWTHDWAGGDVAAATLAGPSEAGHYLGPQVLAASFRGRFPGPEIEPALALEATSAASGATAGASAAGELVLIGCSEMFQNRLLTHESYDHGELLLDIVANQALGSEICESLGRTSARTGLGYVDPHARLAWRAWVVGAAPLLLACFGCAWRLCRRGKGALS